MVGSTSRSFPSQILPLCVFAVIALLLVLAPVAGATRATVLRGWTSTPLRHRGFTRSAERFRVQLDRAHSAIVDGEQVSIEHVPWQVALLGEVTVLYKGREEVLHELCGGAIIGDSRVLTAAHCMFNPTNGEQLPASDFRIVAGSSNLDEAPTTEQSVAASNVRVHPYFSYSAGPGAPDDVAIVTLADPLNLTGPATRAIGVVAVGSAQSEGAQAGFSGFGQENTVFDPSGELNSLGMTLESSEACGGEADALFLCAHAPSGSACNGDSGGGLTSVDGTPMLLGTLSTVQIVSGEACRAGAVNGFTNLAAPEIHDFIEDETASPPMAPRGGGGVNITGIPKAGESITCNPGNWSGDPAFTYTFIDNTTEQVLQSGLSAVYQLASAQVNHTVLCRLQASNAGGTAVEQVSTLRPIEGVEPWVGSHSEEGASIGLAEAKRKEEEREAANRKGLPVVLPIPPEAIVPETGKVSLTGRDITVRSDGIALVKLTCAGNKNCYGKLTLSAKVTSRAKTKRSRTITIGTATLSVAAGATATVKVRLDAVGRVLLGADHGRMSADLTVLESSTGPSQAHSEEVQLVRQKVTRARKSTK
jgi:secreted trypsin-like serine protease